jgi:hypothetical protein
VLAGLALVALVVVPLRQRVHLLATRPPAEHTRRGKGSRRHTDGSLLHTSQITHIIAGPATFGPPVKALCASALVRGGLCEVVIAGVILMGTDRHWTLR